MRVYAVLLGSSGEEASDKVYGEMVPKPGRLEFEPDEPAADGSIPFRVREAGAVVVGLYDAETDGYITSARVGGAVIWR